MDLFRPIWLNKECAPFQCTKGNAFGTVGKNKLISYHRKSPHKKTFLNFHILAIHRKVSTAPPFLQSVVIFYKTSHSASLSFQINGSLFRNFTDLLNFERICFRFYMEVYNFTSIFKVGLYLTKGG